VRARGRGFTLIELLIVIAVISVLVALVSPMLRHAREHARMTLCQGNLRQIYYAMQDYTEDYRGLLPDAVLLNSGPTHPRHLHTLLTYNAGGSTDVFQCPSDQGYFSWFGGAVYTAYFGCSYQNRAERRNFQHWVNAGRLPDGNYYEFAPLRHGQDGQGAVPLPRRPRRGLQPRAPLDRMGEDLVKKRHQVSFCAT